MALPRSLRSVRSDDDRGQLPLPIKSSTFDRAKDLLEVMPDRLMPVQTDPKVSRSIWGTAFCKHLEHYSDFAHRLPRGRTYLRQGAVVHLDIKAGRVTGLVQGTDLYVQRVSIETLDQACTDQLIAACAGHIDAVVDLLSGSLPKPVLSALTDREQGLFPELKDINLQCSCPDDADLCKHLVAVLYGLAVRLDERPDLLFVLRGLNPDALIVRAPSTLCSRPPPPERQLEADLGALFDIEIETDTPPEDNIDPMSPAYFSDDLWADDFDDDDISADNRAERTTPNAASEETSTDDAKTEAPPDALAPVDDNAPILVPRTLLTSAGLSAGQVTSWLRRGLVLHTDQRGVYELTAEGWEALEPLLDPKPRARRRRKRK